MTSSTSTAISSTTPLFYAFNVDIGDYYDDHLDDEALPNDYQKRKLSKLDVIHLVLISGGVVGLIVGLTIQTLGFQHLKLWKWMILYLVLISGRGVCGWGINVIIHVIENKLIPRGCLLYIIYGLRVAVKNCLWSGLVFITWQCYFDKGLQRLETLEKSLEYVTRIFQCLLVGHVEWLFNVTLVKCMALHFHIDMFFDRIQETLFDQYVIKTLSKPSKLENKRVEVDKGITIDDVNQLNKNNITLWNLNRLMRIVKKGIISTLDEQIQGSAFGDGEVVKINIDKKAKATATKIFNNVDKHGKRYIYEDDLIRFMRPNEVEKMMCFFELKNDKLGISKQDLHNWLLMVGQMTLWTTTFLASNNDKIHYPNIALSAMGICKSDNNSDIRESTNVSPSSLQQEP